MSLSRRAALAQFAAAGALTSLWSAPAWADPVAYEYDVLGRLTKVTFPDGEIVSYAYDAAGNRTLLTRADPVTDFIQTIQITGTAPVNLRTLANTAGYDGARNAVVTFEVGSGVTITGAAGSPAGGIGVDTGTWPTGTYAIDLDLVVKSGGIMRGGGGQGGTGGEVMTPVATAGGAGGDAIYCRLPIDVTIQSGGTVQAGGGGGGGGNGGEQFYQDEWAGAGGGGGGGGRPNGPGGGVIGQGDVSMPQSGSAGTPSANGVGGVGGQSYHSGPFGNAEGNQGADGGNFAAAGQTINGAGGAAGYAVRKNGHTVNVTNSGTLTGTAA